MDSTEQFTVITADEVEIHVEITGRGKPILFAHEFAGDHRSWEPQVRHFRDRYRCVVYAARGYPPSEVPERPDAYSQQRAVDDALAVLDYFEISSTHFVGLSMGGFCGLHLALSHPERLRSLCVAGVGFGAHPSQRASFVEETETIATSFMIDFEKTAHRYAWGPSRLPFAEKDPGGHAQFARQLASHSSVGSALTLLGVQRQRPSLFDLQDQFRKLRLPLLVMVGDEDEGCLEVGIMLKREVPTSALLVVPRSGHTLNLEEPGRFNDEVDRFLNLVEFGGWRARDERSRSHKRLLT